MEPRVRRYLFPVALTVLFILVLIAFVSVNVPLQPTPKNPVERLATVASAVVSLTQVNMPTSTNTPTSTRTPTPTNTPTPTPPTFDIYAPVVLNNFPPTPTPGPPRIEILVDEMRVRQGPGLHFPVLYTVHRGDILIVQSKSMNFNQDPWLLIKIRSDGIEEWITGNTRYVKQYNVARLSYRQDR